MNIMNININYICHKIFESEGGTNVRVRSGVVVAIAIVVDISGIARVRVRNGPTNNDTLIKINQKL